MDIRFNNVRTRKEKIWVSSSIKTSEYFIIVTVELNIKTGENKIIFINKREYILIDGKHELDKDQLLNSLGDNVDNEIINRSVIYANDKKYIDRVLKRIYK